MTPKDTPTPPARRPWQRPTVSRLNAGSAENRLEGMRSDSQLALGS